MVEESRTEAHGWALVAPLETFRGFSIQMTSRQSGFNGLSISKHGHVRKIELKAIKRTDKWFAINGLKAIDLLFSDADYWIYFAVLPDNIVVTTHALPFLHKQLRYTNEGTDFTQELRQWLHLTRRLSSDYGLTLTARLHLNVKVPIRDVVKQILGNPDDEYWHDAVSEIWQNEGRWQCLFRSPLDQEVF